jgi:hypothetical protein
VIEYNVRTRPEHTNKFVIYHFLSRLFETYYLFRKQKRDENHPANYNATRFKDQTLLDDTSNILYQSKTEETKRTYEFLLYFIQETIGDAGLFSK